MIASELDVERFRAAAEQVRGGRPDAGVAELLESTAAVLARVFDAGARHERELLALIATAGDLSRLRDTDQLLGAIVRRARVLLNADAAYITLFDAERGDTYMRVTDGIRGEAFKRLRLPHGAGLGGAVASLLKPLTSDDYLGDARFDHTSPIDAAVAEEQLAAILGVPVINGDEAIGVLFTAHRAARHWRSEEVTLLQALADHAAVALENARLFEDAERAVDEVRAANTTIRVQNEALERAAALHERLAQTVLEGGGLDEVAAAAVAVLGGFLIVCDAAGLVIAAAGEPVDDTDRHIVAAGAVPVARTDGCASVGGAARAGATPVRGAGRAGEALRVGGAASAPSVAATAAVADMVTASLQAAFSDAGTKARSVLADSGLARRHVVAVRAGGELFGYVVLARTTPADEAERRSLERVTQVAALVMLGERTVAEAEQRARGDLLVDLLHARDDELAALARRAGLLGVDLHQPLCVVAARVSESDRRAVAAAAGRVAVGANGLAGVVDGDVVLALPGHDAARVAETAWRDLGAHAVAPVAAGGSGPAEGVAELLAAAREARTCAARLVTLGRTSGWATPAELGVFGMLLGDTGGERIAEFVTSRVGALVDADRARGSELVATLEALLANHFNLTRTSEQLIIHVNTLRQRIDRIEALLGPNWRAPDHTLELQLALTLRRVLPSA